MRRAFLFSFCSLSLSSLFTGPFSVQALDSQPPPMPHGSVIESPAIVPFLVFKTYRSALISCFSPVHILQKGGQLLA
ncbi:hypothetical protein SLA2020_287110 [Shorea laevis]